MSQDRFQSLDLHAMTGDFRSLILETLRTQKRAKGDFAAAVANRVKCNPETVSRFLRGSHDTSVEVLEAMLSELGYEIPEAESESD